MQTLKDFDRLYYNNLLPDLKKLEAERKRVAQKVVLIWIFGTLVIALFGILGVFFYFNFDHCDPLSIMPWFFAPLTLVVVVLQVVKGRYIRTFKDKIIATMVKALQDNLLYAKSSCVNRTYFMESELFKLNIENGCGQLGGGFLNQGGIEYSGSDYIAGRINNVSVELSQLNVLQKSEDSENRVFNGVFIWADFNKYFEGETFVRPSGLTTKFQKLFDPRYQHINVEDAEFEKYFVVYGSDQIESRYILSNNLMHRLTQMRKSLNRPFHVSFLHSKMYLAIPYADDDIFAPPLFSSLLEFQNLRTYFELLLVLTNLVENLRLDTQIWGKHIQVSVPTESAKGSTENPVATPGFEAPQDMPPSVENDTRLDLNQATVEQIEALPGINLPLARIAVKLRQENGGFHSIDEFMDLLGLDPLYRDRIYAKVRL